MPDTVVARLCPRPGAGANDAPWMRPQNTRETARARHRDELRRDRGGGGGARRRRRGRILSNVVRAQWEQHRRYGGVVPEIAARAHVECLDEIVAQALREAGVGLGQLAAVAVTAGPGLIGGLLVGVATAKALALVHKLPLVAVNHLEAHALTVGLTEGLQPPYLLLLVSGGHTQLLVVHGVGRYQRLGTTIDDALGEAFDKTAKLLGLGFPGGPAVEQAARAGRAERFALPRPMLGRPEPHFSFAGLKTAVRHQAQALVPLERAATSPTCAPPSRRPWPRAWRTGCGGRWRSPTSGSAPGSAPPRGRRRRCRQHAPARGAGRRCRAARATQLHVPPPALCTDNAAMVAWAGAERLARGWTDGLDVAARARWPLDPDATPALGGGKQGAKA